MAAIGMVLAAGPLALAARPAPQDKGANMHRVSVQFDYDFTKNPPCGEKPGMKNCVKQFDVYDVSGERFKLFSIPVPKEAKGMVKGISGQSPARVFLPGTHFLAVTAENAEGVESDSNVAKIRVEIKAKTADAAGQAK
jgi:hypothetical protein